MGTNNVFKILAIVLPFIFLIYSFIIQVNFWKGDYKKWFKDKYGYNPRFFSLDFNKLKSVPAMVIPTAKRDDLIKKHYRRYIISWVLFVLSLLIPLLFGY
jgi:hypothetical protein